MTIANKMTEKYSVGDQVQFTDGQDTGRIIGVAAYNQYEPEYRVRFAAGDYRITESDLLPVR